MNKLEYILICYLIFVVAFFLGRFIEAISVGNLRF
jgi:hypothetical protein